MANFQSGGYDPKVYSICAPWNGERGPKFTRIFEPAFKNGLLGKHDDFDNLFTTLNDDDMGGAGPAARPFPPGGGGAGMIGYRAKAMQAHNSRRLGLILQSMDLSSRISITVQLSRSHRMKV